MALSRSHRAHTTEPKPRQQLFPQQLWDIMTKEDRSIIAWTEDGSAFKVHDTQRMISEVLPKYFRHTKMTSFQKQLNLYGFTHVNQGKDAGNYSHPSFIRGQPDLLEHVKRGVKASASEEDLMVQSPESDPRIVGTISGAAGALGHSQGQPHGQLHPPWMGQEAAMQYWAHTGGGPGLETGFSHTQHEDDHMSAQGTEGSQGFQHHYGPMDGHHYSVHYSNHSGHDHGGHGSEPQPETHRNSRPPGAFPPVPFPSSSFPLGYSNKPYTMTPGMSHGGAPSTTTFPSAVYHTQQIYSQPATTTHPSFTSVTQQQQQQLLSSGSQDEAAGDRPTGVLRRLSSKSRQEGERGREIQRRRTTEEDITEEAVASASASGGPSPGPGHAGHGPGSHGPHMNATGQYAADALLEHFDTDLLELASHLETPSGHPGDMIDPFGNRSVGGFLAMEMQAQISYPRFGQPGTAGMGGMGPMGGMGSMGAIGGMGGKPLAMSARPAPVRRQSNQMLRASPARTSFDSGLSGGLGASGGGLAAVTVSTGRSFDSLSSSHGAATGVMSRMSRGGVLVPPGPRRSGSWPTQKLLSVEARLRSIRKLASLSSLPRNQVDSITDLTAQMHLSAPAAASAASTASTAPTSTTVPTTTSVAGFAAAAAGAAAVSNVESTRIQMDVATSIQEVYNDIIRHQAAPNRTLQEGQEMAHYESGARQLIQTTGAVDALATALRIISQGRFDSGL